MIDANGTRFHLLLGESDWLRARSEHGDPAFPPEDSPPSDDPRELQWNPTRQDVTLWKETFRFPGSRNERPINLDARRGAARDKFGNWYWIAPDAHSILVWSTGSKQTSTFWPVDQSCADREPRNEGSFRSAPRPAAVPSTFQGLTITHDHYLVAGIAGGVGTAGLAIFDLYAGGAPRRRLWPVAFNPFDLDARDGGGVWVLDRTWKRIWEIDRRFEVVVQRSAATLTPDDGWFTCTDGTAPIWLRPVLQSGQGWAAGDIDAVAIAALPGAAGVLLLERDDGDGFARVHWLQNGNPHGAPASTRVVLRHLAPAPGTKPFTLIAHDFALGARLANGQAHEMSWSREGQSRQSLLHCDSNDPATWSGRLYIVGTDGNQAFAFGVDTSGDHLVLHPLSEYYPMRLFGGRALAAADGEPWYDSGDTWVRLVRQDRPRYAEEGQLLRR